MKFHLLFGIFSGEIFKGGEGLYPMFHGTSMLLAFIRSWCFLFAGGKSQLRVLHVDLFVAIETAHG